MQQSEGSRLEAFRRVIEALGKLGGNDRFSDEVHPPERKQRIAVKPVHPGQLVGRHTAGLDREENRACQLTLSRKGIAHSQVSATNGLQNGSLDRGSSLETIHAVPLCRGEDLRHRQQRSAGVGSCAHQEIAEEEAQDLVAGRRVTRGEAIGALRAVAFAGKAPGLDGRMGPPRHRRQEGNRDDGQAQHMLPSELAQLVPSAGKPSADRHPGARPADVVAELRGRGVALPHVGVGRLEDDRLEVAANPRVESRGPARRAPLELVERDARGG